jgi:mannose-6-phosphate isomerase class I
LFDWNRMGLDGKPRELNVRKAADVLNYRAVHQSTLAQIEYVFEGLERTALIADPRFTVERIVATRVAAAISTNGRPLIVLSLEQPMDLACCGTTVALQKYQTAIIPAAAGWCSVRAAETSAPFLLVTPPESPQQCEARRLAAGISAAKTAAFIQQFAAVDGSDITA